MRMLDGSPKCRKNFTSNESIDYGNRFFFNLLNKKNFAAPKRDSIE